jgi:hypothetical protein
MYSISCHVQTRLQGVNLQRVSSVGPQCDLVMIIIWVLQGEGGVTSHSVKCRAIQWSS